MGCAGKDMKLTTQGSEAIFMNDYKNAEKYLNEALALNPENPYALLNMGVVYENTDRQEQAIAMYQKVIDINPKGKDDQSITELARTKLKNLQMEMARNYRPVEKSYLTASEEPDLKDFFPSLKDPAPKNTDPDPERPSMTQQTVNPSTPSQESVYSEVSAPSIESTRSEGAAPSIESTHSEGAAPANESTPSEGTFPARANPSKTIPTDDMEKKILEPLSPPHPAREVKKADETPTAPSPEAGKIAPAEKIYSIQVASYKGLDGAVKRIAELIESGYDAFYKKAEIKGKGTWHRIFVGKYKTREEALHKAQTMKDQKVISDFMIKVI
jgi:cell division septation protein DedD